MIALSAIYKTIKAYDDFLTGIAIEEIDEINEMVQELDELNEAGEYEAWMKTRWGDLKWWIAAAILYNRMTMKRIKEGNFRDHQLKKIDANSTRKNRTKFKRLLVDAWIAHCTKLGLDPEIFADALDEGIDYAH